MTMDLRQFTKMVTDTTAVSWPEICAVGDMLQKLSEKTPNTFARAELARVVEQEIGIKLDAKRTVKETKSFARHVGVTHDFEDVFAAEEVTRHEHHWSLPDPAKMPNTLGLITDKLHNASDALHQSHCAEHKSYMTAPETEARGAMRRMLSEFNRFIEATERTNIVGGGAQSVG